MFHIPPSILDPKSDQLSNSFIFISHFLKIFKNPNIARKLKLKCLLEFRITLALIFENKQANKNPHNLHYYVWRLEDNRASQFFPSTMWFLEIQLTVSFLVANYFPSWDTLSTQILNATLCHWRKCLRKRCQLE